jgi:hypothetical protein
MPHHMRILLPASRARRTAGALMAAGLCALSVACGDAPTNVRLVDRPSLGKTPAGPAVTSVSPSYARRGTTLDVHVFGSGFTAGAAAEWAIAGVPNAAKVRTNSTTVVSASELVANITVSADADLAYWDIAVTLIGGKKGVGTEKFEVTTAQVLGTGIGGYVMGASEQVSAVGYGDLSGAWVYDNISGATVDLGAGQAWGIDPTGTTALGRDGGFIPVAWLRAATGAWTKQFLPGGASGGNATSAALASDGTLLVGGWTAVQLRRNETVPLPAVWRRVAGSWSAPVAYAIPGASGGIYDVTAGGIAAGRAAQPDGSVHGMIWDSPTTYTVLDGIAYAINPAGTIVVGDRAGLPVYWYRTAGGGWNAVGTALPLSCAGCTAGRANDVNDAGIIVGGSRVSTGKSKATVWRLDMSAAVPTLVGAPVALSGLGAGSGGDNSSAAAITNTAPYVVVGAASSGSSVAVRWASPF